MHDFKNFPELRNSEMELYYWESPHKQIGESFTAQCVKVHDGDTITLRWTERDFDFPVRLSNVSCRELKEVPGQNTEFQFSATGKEAQSWLEKEVLNQEVEILINKANRVDKWGRLLGRVFFNGNDVGEEEIVNGLAIPWSNRNDGRMNAFENQLKGAEVKSF